MDAKSILYLKSCKNSDFVLVRYSVALSQYECSIEHVPGKHESFQLIDALSRSRSPADIEEASCLSSEEAEKLLKMIELPESYKISKELLKKYLEDPADLPSLKKKKPSTTKSKITVLKPIIKSEKKKKLPFLPR